MATNLKAFFENQLSGLLSYAGQNCISLERGVYVYCGKTGDSIPVALKRDVPENAVLLWLCPGSTDLPEESVIFPPEDLTLTLPAENIELLKEELWLVALCLKIEKYFFFSGVSDNSGKATEKVVRSVFDEAVLNIGNQRICGLLKLRASVQNLPLILQNVDNAFRKFPADVPVIICGSGPSLAGQYDLIRELQDKVIIIAVGRTGLNLRNNSIKPDITVFEDPETFNEEMFPDSSPEGLLAAITSTSHKCAFKYKKIVWFNGDSPYFNRFLQKQDIKLQDIPFSKTSTITAIGLALKYSSGAIALAGCDCCLSGSGTVHTDSYLADDTYSRDSRMEVPGNYSAKVITLGELELIRREIERFVAGNAGKDNIYNCTNGGALIRNTKLMSLADFLEHHASNPKKSSLLKKRDVHIPDGFNIDFTGKNWRDFMNSVRQTATCAGDIRKKIDSGEHDKAESLMRVFVKLERDELQKAEQFEVFEFSEALRNYSEDVTSKIPRLETDNRVRRIRFNATRYSLYAGLCDDIARDFAYIARGTPEMKGRDPYPGSIRFDAFRNFAADFISLNNPEFGTALKARAEFRRKIDFNFISMGQDYPGINIKAGKREYKITPDPVGDATRVRELAAGNAFDPARDIAVVITAGDWYFAKTFVELYSKAELVIVEPYPCILSAASDVSMFTHYFSENTLVIGIDKSLEYAGQLYRDKINSAAKICLFPALRAEPSITRLIPDAN